MQQPQAAVLFSIWSCPFAVQTHLQMLICYYIKFVPLQNPTQLFPPLFILIVKLCSGLSLPIHHQVSPLSICLSQCRATTPCAFPHTKLMQGTGASSKDSSLLYTEQRLKW